MRPAINFLFNLGDEATKKKYSLTFLIDLSGSMQGEPLEQVKIALIKTLSPLIESTVNTIGPKADDVSLFTFHSTVQKVCPRVENENFDFFKEALLKLENLVFSESGATALYDGIVTALNDIENNPKEENENLLIIFSDGGEFGSKINKRDVELQINRLKNGYLDLENPQIEEIWKKYKDALKKLFWEDKKNQLLIAIQFIEKGILSFLTDNEKRLILENLNKTRVNLKIYPLLYRALSSSTRGEKILRDFATQTDGDLFIAPSETEIPNILKTMLKTIFYENSSSVRNDVINRLNNSFVSENLGLIDWFRVISFNFYPTTDSDRKIYNKFFKSEKNSDKGSYINSIYYCNKDDNLINDRNKFSFSRQIDHKLLNEIKDDIEANLADQKQKINFAKIDSVPNVNFIMRGNDLLGFSLVFEIRKFLNDFVKNSFFGPQVAPRYTLVILLEDIMQYSAEDKKLLESFLIEVENNDEFDFDNVIFVTGQNYSATDNPFGYKKLKTDIFEELVVESVVSLSTLSSFINDLAVNFGEANRKEVKYISIGSFSLFLDRKKLIKRSSLLFARKFLKDLFSQEIKVDKNNIDFSVSDLLQDIKPTGLIPKLIESGKEKSLFEMIDAPDILLLGTYSKRKTLRYYSRLKGYDLYEYKEYVYRNELDYIRKVVFDIKNVLESAHSTALFENEVERNFYNYFIEIVAKIRRITDNKMFGNPSISSPRQAEEWLKKAIEVISNYLNNSLVNEIENYDLFSKYNRFEYRTSSGKLFTDPNPQRYFNELVRKIQSLPLATALRAKYYMLAMSSAVGIFALVTVLPISFLFYGLLAVSPIIAFVGEYKLKTSRSQVKELLRLYYEAHKFTARKNAVEVLKEKVNDFSKALLKKLGGEIEADDDNEEKELYDEENISELTYIEKFKVANTKTFNQLLQFEAGKLEDETQFHVDISNPISYLLEDSNLDDVTTELDKVLEVNKMTPEQHLRIMLGKESDFEKYTFASTEIYFRPDLNNLSDEIKNKLEVIKLIDNRLYKIVLYDLLTEDEQDELFKLYDREEWQEALKELFNKMGQKITLKNTNFMALWRNIAQYEIWLEHLIKKVEKQKNFNGVKVENIFKLWLKMYDARKSFINELLEYSKEHYDKQIKTIVDLWKIIEGNSNKEILYNNIIAFSYPSLAVNIIDDSNLNLVRQYWASTKNDRASLKQKFLNPSIFNKSHFIEKNIDSDYVLYFTSGRPIPFGDETSIIPLLKNVIKENDKILLERKYFSQKFWTEVLEFNENENEVKKKKIKKIRFPFEEE